MYQREIACSKEVIMALWLNHLALTGFCGGGSHMALDAGSESAD